MAEEQAEEVKLESKADSATQDRALKMGWIPPTRFKGDAEHFVDAEEYLRKGEEMLPIVKANNRRLEADLTATKGELQGVKAALAATNKAIEDMQEQHAVERQKTAEKARADLKAELLEASKAGDHEGVVQLTDELTRLNVAEATATTKDTKVDDKGVTKAEEFIPPADLKEWIADGNEWFGKDKRKTSLALAIAQELREGGETRQGRQFYDLVGDELEKVFPAAKKPDSKVEGTRNGGGDDDRGSGARKKGYASLPADAKQACDADERRFVGKNKRYKTQAEWRSRYAELYFQE